LPRILQTLLYLLNDVSGEPHCSQVVNLFWLNQDANFTTGLNSIGLLYSLKAIGYILQFFQPLKVMFQRLAPGSRPGTADGISRGDNKAPDAGSIGLKVVLSDALGYLRGFIPLLNQVGPDGSMRTFYLPVYRFTNIVKQSSFLG
jgi:hypothetical protein